MDPSDPTHLGVLRGPGDEHEGALLVIKRLHVHQGAEVVELLGQGRLGLVPDYLGVRAEVLDIRPPLAVPVVFCFVFRCRWLVLCFFVVVYIFTSWSFMLLSSSPPSSATVLPAISA